ncbi:MAG: MBL fold metallo-hydrolase [Pseudomonadota bacterium]
MLSRLAVTTALAIIATTSPISALDLGEGFGIRTYASPDPDSVNSHFIETPDGLIVISAQRTFSEAERALARVERTAKPVLAIIIPVPHTDHFGGLTRWREAFPDAQVIAAAATVQSMDTDGQGYVASRKEALGDDFPSQAEVDASLPDTMVSDGDEITVDGMRLVFHDLPGNNAPTNTMVELPDHGVLFTSEVVEDGVTAFLRDADLDLWLEQLATLPEEFPDVQIFYPAHGTPGAPAPLLSQMKAHLTMYRDGIDAALADDGVVDDEETAALVARIEAAYPDYAQVARVPRERLIAANIAWQAERRGETN